ncbi:type II toxin-antitoxin system HicA family toxin [Lactobacillus xylocopicola]|uniref:Toxin HicA n=1 Tax=Lactobacillus xylocopicola TaxID=2976676 RepID=A0ABN6SL26_9LACO|nr:type II toxin-antitoxin system HicA family toxin [Lactobacillus xylocopicola]BDR61080.1 hypothetical protein KIM322_13410 [Lactobacillus xylocopicola]
MPMTPRAMIKLLEKNGFIKKSQTGSHVKLYNPSSNTTTVVPMHSNVMSKGLEQSILKQAGLK